MLSRAFKPTATHLVAFRTFSTLLYKGPVAQPGDKVSEQDFLRFFKLAGLKRVRGKALEKLSTIHAAQGGNSKVAFIDVKGGLNAADAGDECYPTSSQKKLAQSGSQLNILYISKKGFCEAARWTPTTLARMGLQVYQTTKLTILPDAKLKIPVPLEQRLCPSKDFSSFAEMSLAISNKDMFRQVIGAIKEPSQKGEGNKGMKTLLFYLMADSQPNENYLIMQSESNKITSCNYIESFIHLKGRALKLCAIPDIAVFIRQLQNNHKTTTNENEVPVLFFANASNIKNKPDRDFIPQAVAQAILIAHHRFRNGLIERVAL